MFCVVAPGTAATPTTAAGADIAWGDGTPLATPAPAALPVSPSALAGEMASARAVEEIQLAGPVRRVSRRTARRTSRRHELVYD